MLLDTFYIVLFSLLLAVPCYSLTLPAFLRRFHGLSLRRSDSTESSNRLPKAILGVPNSGLQNSSTITEGQALINSWLGRRSACNYGYYLCSSKLEQTNFKHLFLPLLFPSATTDQSQLQVELYAASPGIVALT